MSQRRSVKHIVVGLGATLLLTTGAVVGTAPAARTTAALTAARATACIQTAVGSHAGMVTKLEAETKRGQHRCDVKIVDDMGKKYTVQIDVMTNQVVKTK